VIICDDEFVPGDEKGECRWCSAQPTPPASSSRICARPPRSSGSGRRRVFGSSCAVS